MAQTYTNSFWTIAATGSESGSGACLFHRWNLGGREGERLSRRKELLDVYVLSGSHNGAAFEVHVLNRSSAVHTQLSGHRTAFATTAPLLK
jgi:hypothetical protein